MKDKQLKHLANWPEPLCYAVIFSSQQTTTDSACAEIAERIAKVERSYGFNRDA